MTPFDNPWKIGDRVTLGPELAELAPNRGRGTVVAVHKQWCWVAWDSFIATPPEAHCYSDLASPAVVVGSMWQTAKGRPPFIVVEADEHGVKACFPADEHHYFIDRRYIIDHCLPYTPETP